MTTGSGNLFEAHEVCINLKLLKFIRFYQLINPNSPLIFGWNRYQFFLILFGLIAQCILVFGISDIFFMMKHSQNINTIDYLITTVVVIHYHLNFFKIIVVLFHSDIIWDLMNVSHIHFFKSQLCYKYRKILYKCRDKTIKITNVYCITFGIIAIQWLTFPKIVNFFFRTSTNENIRKQIIFNFWFPISTHAFNDHYSIFYTLDMYFGIASTYFLIIIDIFIMSFCWVICAQYNVLTNAYKNINEDNNSEKGKKSDDSNIESLNSIITDQIQLNEKVKSFYLVIRPIILVLFTINTCLFIVLSYASILMYKSEKLYSILNILKLSSSTVFLSFELFAYSYLLDIVNALKESINFGIYSCNWTNMSIKFKKSLLLTMRMNDANQLKIKGSPKKIINLQLFANIMSMSYNMVSVLLKTTNKRNEQTK